MKHWLETRQVLDRLAELRIAGKRAALATVVRVRGSAYRHEGAKMLIADDGSTTGNVSGGCLEADVREVALQVIETGAATRREYCATADEVSAWDLGVGCEGSVEVFVERQTLPDKMRTPTGERRTGDWDFAEQCLEAHVPFAVCTDLQTGRRLTVSGWEVAGELDATVAVKARALIATRESGIHEIDERQVFIDVFTPPPQLVVISAGDDAQHLARIAQEVGFRIVVVDRRPALLSRERFPYGMRLVQTDAEGLVGRVSFDGESYAVVMTHNFADDRGYVRALLQTSVPYIGVLGPRQRTERIIRELSSAGTVDERRIFGPVGLDIGTDGAEQVALSVVGEILAVRSGRRPISLRERSHPIHADHHG